GAGRGCRPPGGGPPVHCGSGNAYTRFNVVIVSVCFRPAGGFVFSSTLKPAASDSFLFILTSSDRSFLIEVLLEPLSLTNLSIKRVVAVNWWKKSMPAVPTTSL